MERKDFIKLMAAIPVSGTFLSFNELEQVSRQFALTSKLPVLFTSHGSPMDILNDTTLFRVLKKQGEDIRKNYTVNAVLIVSAHWNTNGTFVNMSKFPETIYDFSGFPKEFYEVKYKAPGSTELANEIAAFSTDIKTTTDWGFDHGSWPILRHLFPKGDMPIVQMSMDYTKPAAYHYELAQKIKSLRERGVLIIGSGSLVHNIPLAMKKFRNGDPSPYGWETEFDEWVMKKVKEGDFHSLVNYKNEKLTKLAAPTPDHYVPLLYSLGVVDTNESVASIHEGMYAGFSDRSFRVG